MDCGDWGLLCVLISSLLQVVSESSPWDKLKVLAALGGVAFGFWKWWYAAERNMHKRLGEYLSKNNRRLLSAQDYILDALERPNLGGSATASLFAVPPLRRVLSRKGWETIGSNEPAEITVRKDLRQAVEKLDNQIQVSRGLVDNYRRQLSGAYVLQGAISSAIAREAWTLHARLQHEVEALTWFREALRIPGFANDIRIRRLEAHQLRKLGHANQALTAYDQIETLSVNLVDERDRDLLLADCQRWRAAIMQALRLYQFEQTGNGPQGTQTARNLMQQPANGNGAPGALDLRAQYSPFRAWDAVDQGDMHYLTAFLNFKLGNASLEQQQLDDAELQYQLALQSTHGLSRFASRKLWKLRQASKRGIQRVTQAKSRQWYDRTWLLPPPTPIDDAN